MGTRLYRPPAPDAVNVNTDSLDDIPQRRAREELLPMAAKKTRNAINVIPRRFEMFTRIHAGRRCSCFINEDDPSGSCNLCFSTGVVGGYTKRGTEQAMLDVTAAKIGMVNVAVDYGSQHRPLPFSLRSTALVGELDWSVELQPNVGILDVWDVLAHTPPGAKVHPYVKAPSETSYVLVTTENVRVRLGHRRLDFRFVLKRDSAKGELPLLYGARFRYKTLAVSTVPMDIPNRAYSIVMEEYGITNSFTSQTFRCDNTVRNYTPEDVLYDEQEGFKWKVITVNNNDPMGVTLGTELEVRIVNPWDVYSRIPVGNVPALQDTIFQMTSRQVVEQQQARQGTFQQPMGKPIQGGRFPAQMDQANPVNTTGQTPGAMNITITPDTVRRR